MLLPVLVLVAAAHAPAPSAAPAVSRTYVVARVNGRPLPYDDRFVTTPGYEHRARFERLLVRLDPDGQFVITVLGAYRDVPRAQPGGAGQARDETVRGRWTRRGAAVTLTPAPSKRGKTWAPATGRLTGAGLVLHYEIGWAYGGRWGTRQYTLHAAHDPSYL